MSDLDQTCLFDLHARLGAKFVPFAGYDMPVQYPAGVMKEHLHTREAAGLFDVSHMGQAILRGATVADAAAALETLVPMDVSGLAQGRQRYGLLTNDAGGIRDDFMFANRGDHLLLVVNAACKQDDLAYLRDRLPPGVTIEEITDRALLALQGPKAEEALGRLLPGVGRMRFMDVADHAWEGTTLWVSRSGYTGEDGFELSLPCADAERFAEALLDMAEVAPIGLGARDSLRLEAGLCLYGSDIDIGTSPVEAGLNWAIQKVRRTGGGRAGGFPGDKRILAELADGVGRRRVGLRPEGRAPMRGGTRLFADESAAETVGHITSGGFGPSLGAPVAMGYVDASHIAAGTVLYGDVRGKRLPVSVAELPFVPARFKR